MAHFNITRNTTTLTHYDDNPMPPFEALKKGILKLIIFLTILFSKVPFFETSF